MSEAPTITALVVYESMFGNTEHIAHAIAAGLRLEDVEARVHEVASFTGPVPEDVDLLVVGAPTHAFSLSRPSTRADAVSRGGRAEAERAGLREWLTSLPRVSGHGRLAAAFDTRVSKVRYLPASASRRAARFLVERGYEMVAGPRGFLVQDLEGPLESRQTEQAISWARTVAQEARIRLAAAVVH